MRRRQRVHRRFAIRACDAEQPLTHARMLRTTVNDRHRELRMFGFGKSIRDPLADTKSAERWLASFPANDPLAVHVELLNELGDTAELVQQLDVHGKRIVGGKRRQPALGRFRVGERIPDRFAEPEHPQFPVPVVDCRTQHPRVRERLFSVTRPDRKTAMNPLPPSHRSLPPGDHLPITYRGQGRLSASGMYRATYEPCSTACAEISEIDRLPLYLCSTF